jgi:N-acetylmuramoyl-L-alanine amidase
VQVEEGWAEVRVAGQSFRFLLGSHLVATGDGLVPLAGAATLNRDTVFVPFQFVAELLPRATGDRLHYDVRAARLVDQSSRSVPITAGWKPKPLPADAAGTTTSSLGGGVRPDVPAGGKLRPGHVVTVDAGHGGVDPGTAGEFLPKGVREKNITLAVSLMLREELRERGVAVRMTRTRDTLIALGDRGDYCSKSCDLFVSLHVNALPKRPGHTSVRGFETYFLAEAKTEDAARVARMENEAVRFEASRSDQAPIDGLDFLLRDLQLNEYLRESAHVAELIQASLGKVHDGPDRGVKQAGFMVLTTARRPAVLVEMGYGTNPKDGKLLADPKRQRKLASAIADAIVAYLTD